MHKLSQRMKPREKHGEKQHSEKYTGKVHACVLAHVSFKYQQAKHPKNYTDHAHGRVFDRAHPSPKSYREEHVCVYDGHAYVR